jgi:hypothetical protein
LNPVQISRTAKERFILKLGEDEFRDRVVRPVLLLRGYKDGRDLCGPTEQGRDALFYDYDRLENLEVTAIQTKKGSVNLAAKASANIVNLVAQLQTASQTTYALMKPIRAKVKASKTILIVSGKINESARKHLVDEVKETKLLFLDIDDFIPWIDEVMPHLWLDIDSNVSAYYAALERQLLGGDGPFAKQFLQNGSSVHESCFGDAAVSVYVRKARETYKATKAGGRRTLEPAFPLHALTDKSDKKILLVGDGGTGKTTGLLQIVYKAARDGLERGTQSLIPVLVKASDIGTDKPSELAGYLEAFSKKLTLQKKPVFGLSDLTAGHVHIFVDGLDELADAAQREHVVDLLLKFAISFPKCQVVVSSRPYEFLADLAGLVGFERFNVVPLSWKDAEKILDLVKTKKGVGDEKVKESLRQLSRVQGFSLNPLMVSVYASTANFEAKDVPPNVTELFKRFTEQMLGRWDEQKGLQNLHRPLLKDFVLSAVAFRMHDARTTKISKVDAEAIIKECLEETGHNENAKSVLFEIVSRSTLFRDFGDDIGFRHHMFQEFFAGRAIPDKEFLVAKCGDAWWRRGIVFYFGERPREALNLIDAVKTNHARTPTDRFTSLCTIGLALQACYLSNVADKISIWKEVARGLANSLGEFIESHDPTNQIPTITIASHRLLARDSVALSNVADQDDSIRQWLDAEKHESEDLRVFYFLALMRIGRFDLLSHAEAKDFIKNPNQRLLMMIETVEADLYRPLSATQKASARALYELAVPAYKSLVGIIRRELELQVQMGRLIEQKLTILTSPGEKVVVKNSSDQDQDASGHGS